MRRPTLSAVLGAAVLVCAAAAPHVLAARPAPAPTPRQRSEAQQRNTITVTGFGETRIAPDVALIRLGVETQADTAREAAETNARTAAAVSEAVKRMGIPAAQIQTSWYDVSPVYSREEPEPGGGPPKPPRIVGYRVSNVVSVRLEGKLERVGEVIDTALEAGANRVDGLSFDVRDRSKALQTAIRGAVRNAALKAQALASALKVQLGPPRVVSEQGAVSVAQYPVFRGAEGFSAATPISPGTIQVTANVVIQYSFR